MVLAARDTEAPEPYVVPPSQKFEGNDGSWSTFQISVGTPGQGFRVLPSTKGGVTYVIAPEGCLPDVDPENCHDLRGIDVFKSSPNTGFQVGESTTWSSIGQYEVDLEQNLNFTAGGLYGFDHVSLGPAADSETSVSLEQQVVASIADPTYYLGVLPLGQVQQSFSSLSQSVDSLLFQLRNNTKIPSLSYAYTAGAKYRLKSVFGSLILGGYDATRFKPTPNNFSFTFSNDPSKLLTVGVQSILAMNTMEGTYSMTSNSHFSVIDSTVPHLWLPEAVCDEFEYAFKLTYDPQTDLYLVNDTIHEQLREKNPSLTIKLVNSLEDSEMEYTNVVLPYAALDLQASYPYYPNATNYFPIRRATSDTQYTLGRTLLQEAYLIVDYGRSNFTIAQTVWPDPLPAAQIITITPPGSKSSTDTGGGLSTGAIIGIALGSLAVVALLLIAALIYLRRRRTRTQRYELASKHVSDPTASGSYIATPTPLKSPDPHELSGTPLTELASPDLRGDQTITEHYGHVYPQDRKTVLSVTDTPQELHGESSGPVTPRWQEVVLPPPQYDDGHAANSNTRSGPVDEKYNPDASSNSNDTAPQELQAESRSTPPITPRWQEVHLPAARSSDPQAERWQDVILPPNAQRYTDGDPFATPGVSPLTPQFHERYHR